MTEILIKNIFFSGKIPIVYIVSLILVFSAFVKIQLKIEKKSGVNLFPADVFSDFAFLSFLACGDTIVVTTFNSRGKNHCEANRIGYIYDNL